jgi:hypothetical protein
MSLSRAIPPFGAALRFVLGGQVLRVSPCGGIGERKFGAPTFWEGQSEGPEPCKLGTVGAPSHE